MELKNKSLALTISLYFLMFAYGLSFTVIGPLIPIFMKQYQVSLSNSGLIILFQGIGGILILIAGLIFADRIRKPLLIKIVFIVYFVSLLLIAFAPPYLILLLIFFIIGVSSRMLDFTLNAYISDIHPKKRGFFTNLLHASFGIGALLGPLLPGLFISRQWNWNIIFLVLGIFFIIVFIFFILVQRLEKPVIMASAGGGNAASIFSFFKNKNIIIICVICFLYAGLSTAASTWLPTFMLQNMKVRVFLSTIPVTLLWVGITSGRIVNSVLSLKFNVKYLLLVSNLLGGLVLITIILINNAAGYIVGFAFLGFAISSVVPLSISTACNWYPANTASVSALLVLSLNAGVMIIPWIIGIIADKAGFNLALYLLAAFPLLVSLLTAFLSEDRVHKERTFYACSPD